MKKNGVVSIAEGGRRGMMLAVDDWVAHCVVAEGLPIDVLVLSCCAGCVAVIVLSVARVRSSSRAIVSMPCKRSTVPYVVLSNDGSLSNTRCTKNGL